tara:strand:+ start:365 stop:712 length:348 start_codon:yes stop_codon:yes gene_type:complete
MDLTLDYTDGKYVLLEHKSGDSENEPYPFIIVCERESAADIVDYVVDHYGREDTIHVSELMAMVLELEEAEKFREIEETFSKFTNETLSTIIRHIMESFGVSGDVKYPDNDAENY